MSDAASALSAQPPARETVQPVLPHHLTFAALINTFSKTYRWTRDEALKHSRENALAMRRDVWIMRCLRERKEAVAQLPWHLEPEDAKDAAQKDAADKLTSIVKATPRLQRFLMQLLEATWYGCYANQVVWDNADVGGERPLAVTRHIPVNGDKIQWGWDGIPRVYIYPGARADLEKQGARVVTGDLAPMLLLDTPAWRERFVIHQHEVDDADYFEGEKGGAVGGVGIRDRIYWATWLRDECLSWAVDAMQKVGPGGLLIIPYDASNAAAKAEAETLAGNASQRNVFTMPVPEGREPKNYAPILLPASVQGIAALQEMISNYWDRNIELYIVGQTMSSGADKESGLGGSGRAEFAKDTKWNIIKSDARNLEETLTTDFVRVAAKWNIGGGHDLPFRVRWMFDVPDPDAEKKLAAGKTILDAGLAVKTAELYAAAGFSPPTDDDEIVQLGPGQMGGGDPLNTGGNDGTAGELGTDNNGEGLDASRSTGGSDAAADIQQLKGDSGVSGPVKYAADEGDGKWITIGAKGEEGDKHGGTPVFIQGGKIVRGPKGLVDKHLHELGKRQAKEQADQKAEGKAQASHQRSMDVIQAMKALEGMGFEGFEGEELKRVVKNHLEAAKSAGMKLINEPAGRPDPFADFDRDVAEHEAKKAGGKPAQETPPKQEPAQPPAREAAAAEPWVSVASPSQQKRIDNLIAEGQRLKAKKAPAAEPPAREAGSPPPDATHSNPEWAKHGIKNVTYRQTGDGKWVMRVEKTDGGVPAVHTGARAHLEKLLKERYLLSQHVPRLPTQYEADALRDQLAVDVVAAPHDPEAAKRAKENSSLLRRILRALTGRKEDPVHVHIPTPVLNVQAPPVTVNVPEQPAPVVNVAAPVVNVAAPQVHVAAPEVPAAQVTVNVPEQPAPQVTVNVPPQKTVKVTYDRDGYGHTKSMTVEPQE